MTPAPKSLDYATTIYSRRIDRWPIGSVLGRLDCNKDRRFPVGSEVEYQLLLRRGIRPSEPNSHRPK